MNITEWMAVLATIASVFMLARGKSSGWIFGIIGCVLYSFVFIEQKLYANVIIQIIFIAQGLYGIFEWRKKAPDNKPFSSKTLKNSILFETIFLTIQYSFIISLFMYYYTDNQNPFLDTTLSVCSVVAFSLMIKRVIQAWFFWMVIDIGYIFLFCSIGLWISAGLYVLLFFLCIDGYNKWNRKEIEYTKINS